MRAVLAEQDAATRRTVARTLKQSGYTVDEARDEKQLLDAMKTPTDLVLLDLEMPGMSSVKVVQLVRRQPSSVPVIVMSGRSVVDVVAKALESGAADYLAKPVHGHELELRVRRARQRVRSLLRAARAPRAPKPLAVPLAQLHDERSGRIDARMVAAYVGVPLKQLAEALGASYPAAHKTPDAESLQANLRPIKRCLEILDQVVGNEATVRAWLRSPHPDLGKRSPLEVILEGRAGALETLLENALGGIPS